MNNLLVFLHCDLSRLLLRWTLNFYWLFALFFLGLFRDILYAMYCESEVRTLCPVTVQIVYVCMYVCIQIVRHGHRTLLFLWTCNEKNFLKYIIAIIVILRFMMASYLSADLHWSAFEDLVLILETFNCFVALRRLGEFDSNQPSDEEVTRGMLFNI